ncbi:PepSY domain-containing protein [Virgibacillus byunsanensis]|uniref:PepSY domain-containing protein n=1 Tax=Virgibacillus byunsanensis TaxID=570945 RepID=A0ABW3LIX2_9BACI
MKKKVGIAIATIAGAVVLGLGIYQSDAAKTDPNLSTDEIREMVKAQYPGTITELELEKRSNKAIYEVEVESNGKEYELKLDGNSGEILNLKETDTSKKASNTKEESSNVTMDDDNKDDDSSDTDDKTNKQDDDNTSNENKENSQGVPSKKVVIDVNKAKEIALAEFSGTVKEMDLDDDDGRLIYEIEIRKGNREAELDIDAYTGEVLVLEIEVDDEDDYDG